MSPSEYNPFEHRFVDESSLGDIPTFLHLLKGAIGTGILILPHVFMKTGYAVGLVAGLLIATLGIYNSVNLVVCNHMLCKRAQIPSMDLAQTADAALRMGIPQFRKYAQTFGILTNLLVCVVQYVSITVYAIYVATSTQQIVEHFFDIHMDARIYVAAFYPVYFVLALAPNLTYLTPTSIMGFFCLFSGFFITLYYLFRDFPDPSTMEATTTAEHLPVFCSVFLFAVHNVTIIFPIENSMRHPQRLPYILTASMIINAVMYLTFGFFGYNKYRDACDTIIKNLPCNERLAQCVKVLITLSVVFTFGLQYFVPITILWPMIAKRFGDVYMYEVMFRLGGVLLGVAVSIAFPNLVPMLGIFSSLSVTTVMLLIPALIDFSTKFEYSAGFERIVVCIKNISIAIIWLIFLVTGCIGNIKDMVDYYSGKTNVSDLCD